MTSNETESSPKKKRWPLIAVAAAAFAVICGGVSWAVMDYNAKTRTKLDADWDAAAIQVATAYEELAQVISDDQVVSDHLTLKAKELGTEPPVQLDAAVSIGQEVLDTFVADQRAFTVKAVKANASPADTGSVPASLMIAPASLQAEITGQSGQQSGKAQASLLSTAEMYRQLFPDPGAVDADQPQSGSPQSRDTALDSPALTFTSAANEDPGVTRKDIENLERWAADLKEAREDLLEATYIAVNAAYGAALGEAQERLAASTESLTKALGDAEALSTSSEGKVADEATRTELVAAIDEAKTTIADATNYPLVEAQASDVAIAKSASRLSKAQAAVNQSVAAKSAADQTAASQDDPDSGSWGGYSGNTSGSGNSSSNGGSAWNNGGGGSWSGGGSTGGSGGSGGGSSGSSGGSSGGGWTCEGAGGQWVGGMCVTGDLPWEGQWCTDSGYNNGEMYKCDANGNPI